MRSNNPSEMQSLNFRSSNTAGYGEITEKDARRIASKIMQKYGVRGGISNSGISQMMKDSMRGVNNNYNPSTWEIQNFRNVHSEKDANEISLDIVEAIIRRYYTISDYAIDSSRLVDNTEHDRSTIKSNYQNSIQIEIEELRNELSKYMSPKDITDFLMRGEKIFRGSSQNSESLEYDEMIPVLNETYSLLGISNYTPSHKDIKSYIEIMDYNSNGEISIQKFTYFLLKALVKRHLPKPSETN